MANKTKQRFEQRKRRVRAKIMSQLSRPRLSVFKSNKFIYAQVIDDTKGVTLAGVSSKKVVGKEKITGVARAEKVGEAIAEMALKKKVKKVVFDRSGYKYHGQVKALAEGARKGGLEF